MADVDPAFDYFKSTFLPVFSKQVPFRRHSGTENLWLNESIFFLLDREMLLGPEHRKHLTLWTLWT